MLHDQYWNSSIPGGISFFIQCRRWAVLCIITRPNVQCFVSASDWFKTFENDVIPGDTQRYFPEIANMAAYTVNNDDVFRVVESVIMNERTTLKSFFSLCFVLMF